MDFTLRSILILQRMHKRGLREKLAARISLGREIVLIKGSCGTLILLKTSIRNKFLTIGSTL